MISSAGSSIPVSETCGVLRRYSIRTCTGIANSILQSPSVSSEASSRYEQRRYKSSYQLGKFRFNRQLETQQHYEYLRRLEKPPASDTIDPALTSKDEWVNRIFDYPNPGSTASLPPPEQQGTDKQQQELWKELLEPSMKGELAYLKLKEFGGVKAVHGNIFEVEADVMLVPMVPNFLPSRGFSLHVLERGGPALVKEAFQNVKSILNTRRDFLEKQYAKKLKPTEMKELVEQNVRLHIGDVVFVDGSAVSQNVKLVAFVIMPYYFQGGPTDAARKLRYAIKRALNEINAELPVSSVVMPHLATGVYGYSPTRHSDVLAEEAVECLMQIESSDPVYNLKSITLVDKDKRTAQALADAVTAQREVWLPNEQVVSGEAYWKKKDQRLMEVSTWVVRRCLRRTQFIFRKRHGITRYSYQKWMRNLRPFVWRPARCLEPPPFLMYKNRNAPTPALRQLPARPFFFKGLSHWLIPPPSTGFRTMRVNTKGEWVGVNKNPKIFEETNPRK